MMIDHTRRRFRLLLGLCLLQLTLISCSPLKRPDPPAASTAERITTNAELAVQQRDYAKAADLFRQLAGMQTGNQRDVALLYGTNAELLADNSNVQWVRKTLDELATLSFSGNDALLLQTLQVELAVLDGQPVPIHWDLQSPLPDQSSDPELSQRFFRALLNLRTGYRLRAEALAGSERWLTDPAERLSAQQELLHTLNQLGTAALQSYQQQDELSGWAGLALLSQQFTDDLPGFRAALPGWQTQFADHPALLEPLLEQWQAWFPAPLTIPQRIAVLLPQDERYKTVSNAIRAGILYRAASWPNEQQPNIQFYDSNQAIAAIYQQAVADGADWVIGPLRKEAVTALLPLTDLSVPVLALNQVPLPDVPPSRLFLIGLNPEDEARQVAERLWSDQYRHPAVLAPDNAWGQRLFTAFQTHWSAFSDTRLAVAHYDPTIYDHGMTIRQLLLSDQSDARHQQLQTWLERPLEFSPRRRADIDAIFLIARDTQAQGFAPQLRFHFAGDLPVYATSHVWPGQLSKRQLADMRGIRIPDMPFFISPEVLQPILAATPDQQLAHVRLFALGMDALGILPHIPRLQSDMDALWTGATGVLSLNKTHHIDRQLTWLQLADPIRHIPLTTAQRVTTGGP